MNRGYLRIDCCVQWFLLAVVAILGGATSADAQQRKPNILFIVSDDTGYGDLGPYGGGEGRGMPMPTGN